MVKKRGVLADQNHTLAIVVGQMKSREKRPPIGAERWRNRRIGFLLIMIGFIWIIGVKAM